MSARTPYNILLALCIIWCIPATCLIILGTLAAVSAFLKPDSKDALSFGLAFVFEGILLGLPGFVGAWLLKRKLRELEEPTHAPPGFDVLTPDSHHGHTPPRHR